MDIQEIKEGFEDWFVVNYHDGDIHPNHHLLDFKECDQEYVDDLVNMLWEAWQAAKASVAEGFVLVKRDFTNAAAYAAKSVDGRLSAFKYSDVWNVMVEAQEPSND